MSEQVRRRKKATHPRNPWEKDRIVRELGIIGAYGLRNKNELWTAEAMAKKDKEKSSALLITTDAKEFITQGRILLDRLYKEGMISSVDLNDEEDIRRCLKEVLSFGITQYLDRRLQNLVAKSGLARSVHHARKLIVDKHIVVRGCVVDNPSMIIRRENDGYIELNPRSSVAGFKPGRSLRAKNKKNNDEPQEE